MFFVSTLALLSCWNPAPQGWISDYGLALERAHNEGKFVLADFTGSDWCEYCHQLDSEVFATNEFKDWAKKNVILLQLDYPHDKELPYVVAYQNTAVQNRYQAMLGGYPTVLLLNDQGQVITKTTGYGGSGSTIWVEAMNQAANAFRSKMSVPADISPVPTDTAK